MEVTRKKEFIEERMKEFKLNMDIKAEKREVKRLKLTKAKVFRVEQLELQASPSFATLIQQPLVILRSPFVDPCNV